jgi:hypothetical protein
VQVWAENACASFRRPFHVPFLLNRYFRLAVFDGCFEQNGFFLLAL